MIYGILIFIVLLLIVSIYDLKKVKSFEDFALAGKNQGIVPVYLSLMTSMIGASATLGIADNVWSMGFPAFWWLGVGAIGLFLQGFLLSEKIRGLDADTLPDIAGKTVGGEAKTLISLIIVISWVGIIGAQIVSLAKLVRVVAAGTNENHLIIIIAGVVILYTILGGQLSVVKTDMLQAGIIIVGVISTLIFLMVCKSDNNQVIYDNIKLLGDNFTGLDLINLLFITGGTYFLGPDIVSRNIMSRDKVTAKKATFLAAISILIFGIIITMIGMWTLFNLPTSEGMNPLIYVMDKIIPTPLGILLCLALIATLISSADTCLVNAATIVEHDLLRRNKIWEVRLIIGILGVASLFVALNRLDIIDLLLSSYTIYSPGVVFPLFVAILNHNKREINKVIWLSGVVIGGLIGLAHSYFLIGPEFLPLVGMGISLLLSILSILPIPVKK